MQRSQPQPRETSNACSGEESYHILQGEIRASIIEEHSLEGQCSLAEGGRSSSWGRFRIEVIWVDSDRRMRAGISPYLLETFCRGRGHIKQYCLQGQPFPLRDSVVPQRRYFPGSAILEKLSGFFWVFGEEAIPRFSAFSELGNSPKDSVDYSSCSSTTTFSSSLEITQLIEGATIPHIVLRVFLHLP